MLLNRIVRLLSVAMLALGIAAPAHAEEATGVKNVVLVHGFWADGSGWQGVYERLVKSGYTVSIVQNPLTSLADDVAAVKRVLARQNGPVLLVGHSYAGMVITEAGDTPNVAGLVYLSALFPDVGESVGSLSAGAPPPPVQPSADGFLFFDPALFPTVFSQDLSPEQSAFLAASQIPPSGAIFGSPTTVAAWKTRPAFSIITAEDRVIPPEAQRAWAARAGSTVTEIVASHAAYISQPQAVADAIDKAARSIPAAAPAP